VAASSSLTLKAWERSDFYSEPSTDGSPTLDDAITDYERRLGSLLLGLRNLEIGAAAPGDDAVEVVSHLTARVPGFRHFVGETMLDLVQRAMDHFSKPEVVRGLVGLGGPEATMAFRDRITAELRVDPVRARLREVPDALLIAMSYVQRREGFDAFVAPQAAALQGALRELAARAPEQAAEGHRRMLAEDVARPARADFLAGFRWRIDAAPNEGCILPDCVALGLTRSGELRPSLLCDRNDTAGVAMPLGMDRLLVGAPPDGDWPDLAGFNLAAAAASDNFFVAHSRRPDMEALKARIGSVSAPFRADLIDKVMREYEGRHMAPPRIAPPTEPPRICQVDVPFADAEFAARAVALTEALIARLSEHLALDRLVGVTFASEPIIALVCLDRGDPRLPAYTQAMLPEDLAGASPPIVRDGQICSKTYLHADVGWALADDDDPDDVATAMHVIAHQLAEVSATRRIDQALPGFLLEPIDDPHVNRLVLPAMLAVFAFHAALQSAGFGSEALFETRYRKELLDALERGRTVLEPIANAVAPGDDLGPYYAAARACAGSILVAAAHLAGHRAGLDQDALRDDPDLQERLEQVGLRGWFEVFASDLADLWEVPGSWTTRAPFLAFHRHTERILWALNLFPTPLPDGDTWLIPPMAFQAGEA